MNTKPYPTQNHIEDVLILRLTQALDMPVTPSSTLDSLLNSGLDSLSLFQTVCEAEGDLDITIPDTIFNDPILSVRDLAEKIFHQVASGMPESSGLNDQNTAVTTF